MTRSPFISGSAQAGHKAAQVQRSGPRTHLTFAAKGPDSLDKVIQDSREKDEDPMFGMSAKSRIIALVAPVVLVASTGLIGFAAADAAEPVKNAPAPAVDDKETGTRATAYFAGGCFWGVEGVFSHVKGVISAESGYAGGPAKMTVSYEDVGSGQTGYAETVKVVYNPSQVSYGTLLRIFFSVITNPTTLNYQGPDHGTQYRSALFPQSPAQDKVAKAYLAQLSKAKLW